MFMALAGYLDSVMNAPDKVAKYGRTDYIGRYTTQFEDDSAEGAIPKPALAIAFNAEWTNKTNNQQTGEVIVSVFVAYHTVADPNYFEASNSDALKRDEYHQDVQIALQGFDMGAAGKLQRVREQEDSNHDQITVDRIDYLTVVHDELADPSLQYIEITPEWKIIYKNPTDRPAPTNDGGYILHGHI